eukprot:12840767-Ditylum_brightwellii.AAC.1
MRKERMKIFSGDRRSTRKRRRILESEEQDCITPEASSDAIANNIDNRNHHDGSNYNANALPSLNN